MRRIRTRRPNLWRAGVALATVSVLASCAGQGSSPDQSADEPEAEAELPHGYVEGAEETAEAQPRLVMADTATGEVSVLDLVTEDVHAMDAVPGVEAMAGDGRFAYLTAGDELHVVDGASWMVDHGDHVHYYRAEVRDLGSVTGAPPADVHSDSTVTAVSFGDGRTELLDRDAMEDAGELSPLDVDTDPTADTDGTNGPDDGGNGGNGDEQDDQGRVIVPYAGHLLALTETTDDPDGGTSDTTGTSGTTSAVRVLDDTGTLVDEVDEPCPDAGGQIPTRHGVVVGCGDGALVVSEQDGTFTGERVPYPTSGTGSDAEPAREFSMRAGGDTLAAPAGDSGVWVLDLPEQEWTHLDTGPVVAVNAVGAGPVVLTLTPDGVLRSHDHHTGEETASVPLLDQVPEADSGAAPVLLVDNTRAYVNDPAAQQVHEIDYRDDLRVARTLDVPLSPDHMVETGR